MSTFTAGCQRGTPALLRNRKGRIFRLTCIMSQCLLDLFPYVTEGHAHGRNTQNQLCSKFAVNDSLVSFCSVNSQKYRVRENVQFWCSYTPFFCLLRWLNQTLGKIPRSVREKCAEQPGLQSVNALKQTINTGPIHQSKLKARRSVLTIPGDAFCPSSLPRFYKNKRPFLLRLGPREDEIANMCEGRFLGGFYLWFQVKHCAVAQRFNVLFILGKHSRQFFFPRV